MNSEEELAKIIVERQIVTVFQPIVNLGSGEIIGYEALSRGPKESPLHQPNNLFKAAEIYDRIWELESLCRIKALEAASKINQKTLLFINVDPMIFKDEKFKKGFTKELLVQNQICSDSIVFEITEKTAIEDYKSFKRALDNYVNQGYKIAIDDTGAGYSGLKTLSEIKPHFIKIDMDLVRNIDTDFFKQAIMETFVLLSKATNMKLIAEGIETKDELIKLMELGVYAGQGFFISKPNEDFLNLPKEVYELIKELNKTNLTKNKYAKSFINAATISKKYTFFTVEEMFI